MLIMLAYFVLFFCFFTGLCSLSFGAEVSKTSAAGERTEDKAKDSQLFYLETTFRDSISHNTVDFVYIILSEVPADSYKEVPSDHYRTLPSEPSKQENSNQNPQEVRQYAGNSLAEGKCFLHIPAGKYELRTSIIGYKPVRTLVEIKGDTQLEIWLSPETYTLKDVVVTATESRKTPSASVIDQKAMQHLQPSSFSDIMELVPGNVAEKPVYGQANFIRMREVAAAPTESYNISSLGTLFVVDDVPIPTSSTIETVSSKHSKENMGVDMRTISTDQIEKVEIVRGIPSVEYGDLTSGLVKIKQKIGGKDWSARFKADSRTKLFYLGKGLEFKPQQFKMHIGVDYMDAKIDPRNRLENYKRATASVRTEKKWNMGEHSLQYNTGLNYGGNFDMETNDPDIDFTDDSYHRQTQNLSLNQSLVFKPSQEMDFWEHLSMVFGLNYESSRTDIKRLVQPNRPLPIPNSMEAGEHEAEFLSTKYTAYFTDEGKPFDLYWRTSTLFNFNLPQWTNKIKAGAEYKYSKNFGQGPVFDLNQPLDPTTTVRPRAYNSIPGLNTLAFYAEDISRINVGSNRLEIMAGIRGNSILALSQQHAMHGKVYWDPRVNARWTFPQLEAGGKPLRFELGTGIGMQSKMPTLAHLYPNPIYYDLVEINYFHNNPDWRYLYLKTFIIDPTNYNLVPARNMKWETRFDASYDGYRLSVTYFEEDMHNAFRTESVPLIFHYNNYDITSLEPGFSGKPDYSDFKGQADTSLSSHSQYTNNSRVFKRGIEFQFNTQRIEVIHTRFTFNGAWFYNLYANNEPVYLTNSVIIDNKELPYIGIYEHEGDMVYQQFYTNLIIDTDIPRLGLGFSLSLQCRWLQSQQTIVRSAMPIAYMDNQGNIHPYTEADRSDLYLQHLYKNFSDAIFNRYFTPFSMTANLKVSKTFLKEKIRVSLFVNGIAYLAPPYVVNGIEMKRYNTPYFGMELNLKI